MVKVEEAPSHDRPTLPAPGQFQANCTKPPLHAHPHPIQNRTLMHSAVQTIRQQRISC